MKLYDDKSPANFYNEEIEEMMDEQADGQVQVSKGQSVIKRDKNGLPASFDQSLIIAQIDEMRTQPSQLKKYLYRLRQKFDSRREIKLINQIQERLQAGTSLTAALTEAEKAKVELYKQIRHQEIVDAEVEKEKEKIIASKGADVREEEAREADARARIAEADAKIAEAQARARKAGQTEKKESGLDKLEREIKEKAQAIRLKSQEIEGKITALAELEKKIRIQLAGDEDLIEKYVDLAKGIVFRDPGM